MLMVIFGAGASYDSCDTFRPPTPGSDMESRPPLADELFQQRAFFDEWVRQYPECTTVIPRLRRHSNSTLEAEMERLRAQAEREDQRAVELHAIRYYLRRVLWHCGEAWLRRTSGVTNYGQLLGEIRLWRSNHPSEEVRFVTFNYDTLLEHACEGALRMQIRSVSGYVSGPYRVYKPHGSVNWVRTLGDAMGVDAKNIEHSIIGLGKSLSLSAGFHLLENPGQPLLEARYVYPALALPVNTKVAFECPEDHVARLKADIPAVTKLLVIGWRATEPHFLEFWKQPRSNSVPDKISKIAIVAGGVGPATHVQNQLRASGIEGTFLLSPGGFSEFVTGPGLEEFLAD